MVIDVDDLNPIIEGVLKANYGDAVRNIELVRTIQIPIADDKKESWRSTVKFDDGKTKYEVSIVIRILDGKVTRTDEVVKEHLIK